MRFPAVRKLIKFLVLFFLINSTEVFSQEEDIVEEVEEIVTPSFDTLYIEDYSSRITARIYGLFQEAGLVSNSYDFKQLKYNPNIPGRIGIAGFHKWFGLGLSLGIPIFGRSEDTYGKTKFYDLRVNAFGNKFAAEGFLQNFKGYHVSGSRVDKTYLIPDMNVFSMGAFLYYFINYRKFSIRAAYIQTERQKKSAGSFVIRPSFIYFKLTSDQGIVPLTLRSQITNKAAEYTIEGDFYSFGLAPGYAHTFVLFKYFYLNVAFYPGFYYQSGYYKTNLSNRKTTGMSLAAGLNLAAGYNSSKWFAGAGYRTGLGKIPASLSGADFYYDVTQFRIWGGTRFDWFKKKK